MVTRRRLGIALVLSLLAIAPSLAAGAGPLPAIAPASDGPLDAILANATGQALTAVYKTTGNNLTREDVRIGLLIDFRDLDFDMLGITFGGGRLMAQARVTGHLELRILSVDRITKAIQSAAGDNVNLSQVGLGGQYLTANEFRATLATEAIAAFEAGEQREVERMITKMLPDITVLATTFEWSGTDPMPVLGSPQLQPTDPRRPVQADLVGPPIVLDVTVDVQYLKRDSLYAIVSRGIEKAMDRTDAERQKELEEKDAIARLKAENEGAFYERSAFSTMGLTQLISPEMPPGWDLQTHVKLPLGYTIEYASPDVDVGDSRQTGDTMTLAGLSDEPLSNPVAISLSNRFLVTSALLVVVLLSGAILRFPTMLVAKRVVRRAKK